ncbi:MAG: lysostaphin resistance A-like protein [Candidatus Saccharicenans sp.]
MRRKFDRENGIYWVTFATGLIFFLIFSGVFFIRLDFWTIFSATILGFLLIGLFIDPSFSHYVYLDFQEKVGKSVLLGFISAGLLYGVFMAGNLILPRLLVEAPRNLASIYTLKSGSSGWRIGLFLTLIIAPGEELWWRGFLQRHWSVRLGKWPGMLVVAGLYAAVHLSTKNPVLVLAALVGGLWWGYQYLKYESLLSNVISHLLCDLLVFLIFPFS